MNQTGWRKFAARLHVEFEHLIALSASDRRWQMPFAAALASGLPLLVGAYFDQMAYGLTSTLGGLVFLYLPTTPMYHRMVTLMACAFGLVACYTLGLISHFFSPAVVLMLTFISILVSMVSRFYRVGPPGSLFFVMAASIGAYSPTELLQVPLQVGLLTMGSLLGCLIAFFYSLYVLRLEAPQPVIPLPKATFDFVIFDSVVIGLSVGLSLVLAQLLGLDRPYWVPVSCLAVIQGMSLRAVWNKQLHRIFGTSVGLLLAGLLFALPFEKWSVGLMVIALTFIIESLVVRHYGLATIFITPLTILLAEANTLGQESILAVIEARFFDTLLGCLVGLMGGVCIHSKAFRHVTSSRLRRLIPARLLNVRDDHTRL